MVETFGEYAATKRLGSGGQATTWLASHTSNPDEQLLLKIFHVETMEDWKTAELFQRAARVLERLEHPQIPGYRDHFELERDDGELLLCLVREFAPGESLQERLDRGGSFDEDEVIDIAQQMLGILEYLHGQEPPVIHRDIKPANIIFDDGRVLLVDFGAVQAEVARETGGSTIVGTAGYVSPEQLMGRAEPPSDFYALGVTLVQLLTGIKPTDLPGDGFEIDVSEALETSPGLAYVVGRMTRADIDEREADLGRLLDHFERLSTKSELVVHASTLPVNVPTGSQLTVRELPGSVVVETPRALIWRSVGSASLASPTTAFRIVYLFFAILFVVLMIFQAAPFAATVISIGLVVLAFRGITSIRRPVTVRLEKDLLQLERPMLMKRFDQQVVESLDNVKIVNDDLVVPYRDIERVELVRLEINGGSALRLHVNGVAHVGNVDQEKPTTSLAPTFLGGRERVSGDVALELGLSDGEYVWLSRLINARIAQFRELEDPE